ncbi:MAG TPA: hypothetical protein VFX05_13680 [Casimicrobiaceae bacterium]|nr:hypothetical protein [Casimicrobiaceae bacterium]
MEFAPTDSRGVARDPVRMSRTLALLVMLASCAASAQSGEIYRCDDGGQVAYADRPCSRDAVRIDGAASQGRLVLANLADQSPSAAEPGAASLAGLTSREVLTRFGRPWETRVLWRNRVLTETWIWNRGSQPSQLTFRNGRVVEP